MHNVTFKMGMKGFKTLREQISMLEAPAQAGSARCREKRRKAKRKNTQEEQMKPRRGENRTEREEIDSERHFPRIRTHFDTLLSTET